MKTIKLIILISLLRVLCVAQNPILNNRSSLLSDIANGAVETFDGNFLIAGVQLDGVNNEAKTTIYKINKDGDEIKSKTVLLNGDSMIYSVINIFEINPNKYALFGAKFSSVQGQSSQYFSCEMDSNLVTSGEIIYSLNLSANDNIINIRTIKTSTGFLGVVRAFDFSSYKNFVSQQDINRINLNTTQYNVPSNMDFFPISESISSPNNFYMYTSSLVPSSQIKLLDNQLNEISNQVITSPNSFIQNIKALSPSSILLYRDGANSHITLEKYFIGNGNITVFDTTLRILGAGFTGFPENNSGVDFYYPNQIFYGGTYVGGNKNHINITNVDSNLNKRWSRQYGLSYFPRMQGIIATKDGGCLVLGQRNDSSSSKKEDFYIFKIDSLGIPLWINTISENEKIKASIFPNPCSDILTIMSDEEINNIKIIDMNGKIVLSNKFEKHISIQHLSQGSYILELSNETKKTQKLFLKQ